MPVYEYQCRGCGTRFEAIRRMSERTQAPPCPKCAAEAELALSAPAFLGGSSGGSSSCGTSTWTGGG